MPALPPPLTAQLPARPAPPAALVATPFGSFMFLTEAWTTIEVSSGSEVMDPFSIDSQPFALTIAAAAAQGAGPPAFLTIPRSSRICMFGLTFTLTAYNLVTTAQTVRARAFQGPPVETQNVAEFTLALDPGGTAVSIPPFSQRVRFDVPQAQKATAYLELLSPTGVTVGRYFWAEQPSDGFPVGGLGSITLFGAAGSGRVNFYLGV